VKRLLVSIAPVVVGVSLLVGCGSSTATSAGKAQFCQDDSVLDKATFGVSTADGLLQAIRANQSTIDDFGKTAPPEINTDAQALVTAAKTAVNSNSVAGLADPNLQAAGNRVDAFCGLNSHGDPIGNASSTA
jgi:hypothetical protein